MSIVSEGVKIIIEIDEMQRQILQLAKYKQLAYSNNTWGLKFQKDIAHFGFSAVFYYIRRERNMRFYQQIGKDNEAVLKEILESIFSLQSIGEVT